MKTIEVVAAVIFRAAGSGEVCSADFGHKRDIQIFATQRGYGDWKDWWEFPGGKMEPGETPEMALQREIREELATEIEVGEWLTTVEYDYPAVARTTSEGTTQSEAFHLTMHCYLCTVVSGKLSLLEHEDARWLAMDELDSVRWLPADVEIIKRIVASQSVG